MAHGSRKTRRTDEQTAFRWVASCPLDSPGRACASRLHALAVAALLLLAVVGGGCARDDDAVRAEVQRLALAEGDDALAQADRLSRHGRRALTSIEAILHTADEPGRKNLVVAMRRLGDEEAVPLLMHVAVYDAGASVRREAEVTLRSWAKDPAGGPRADKARQAIRRLEELQQREAAG